ncbi:hypothetical protein ABUL39_07630 [Rhodothermus marinus]|uniref:hypothetical protein n=1 Tax=Rhodothermus marinus TaxID=29549 RepID=UPI0037C73B51
MERQPNQYYRCLGYRETPEPVELARPPARPSYLHRVLQVVESELEGTGLTFFITWKLNVLPEYGDHVVAIVMGDEWSKIPAYVDRVLVTFKCYGIYPQLGVRPLRRPSYLNALVFLRHLRVLAHWLPGALRYTGHYLKRRLQGAAMPPVYDLPLGYGNQLPLPVQPIETRPIDLFLPEASNRGSRSGSGRRTAGCPARSGFPGSACSGRWRPCSVAFQNYVFSCIRTPVLCSMHWSTG